MLECRAILLGLCFLLGACQEAAKRPQAAFYHWQTYLELTPQEQQYLEDLEVRKLYVKFFDIDWKNGAAIPAASVVLKDSLTDIELIPTIFITNRTMLNCSGACLEDLAAKTAQKIQTLAGNRRFTEVQFDCDWSGQSEANYFRWLELMRGHFSEQQLSVTIRLHQVKYFKQTGVPPVDRGMLMCYNVGKVGDWATQNSILDVATVQTYCQNFEQYPLDLDLALPIFGWGVVFRAGDLSRLIHGLSETDLSDQIRFERLSQYRYLVRKETYLQGHFLYAGDQIRLESITSDKLSATAQLLTQHLPKAARTLAFYHLDTFPLQQHPYATLDSILAIFGD